MGTWSLRVRLFPGTLLGQESSLSFRLPPPTLVEEGSSYVGGPSLNCVIGLSQSWNELPFLSCTGK